MATGKVNVGSGGAMLNAFTQLTEPKTKEGIWIKTEKPYRSVEIDNEVSAGGAWTNPFETLPYGLGDSSSVSFGEYIYIFGGVYSTGTSSPRSSRAFRLDPSNGVVTELANMPTNGTCQVAVFNGKIYVGVINGGRAIYEYSIETNTYTQVTSVPSALNEFARFMVGGGDGLQFFGGWNSSTPNSTYYRFIYNVSSDTWSQLPNMNIGGRNFRQVVNDDFYIYIAYGDGSGSQIYRMPINGSSAVSITTTPKAHNYATMTYYDSKIYVFYELNTFTVKELRTFNLQNRTWEQHPDVPNLANRASMVAHDNVVYLIGGRYQAVGYDYIKLIQRFVLVGEEYDDGTFVILRLNERTGIYYTQFVNPFIVPRGDRYARFPVGFNNAWLFIDGELKEYPTYYGNGTQWIKFKN